MSARSRRRLLGVVFLAAGLLAPALAGAQTSSEDRAAAETLFVEGKAFAEKGELPAACDRFEKSQGLDPQVGTLLYLATCHEQLKQTATAWVEFKDALGQAEAANKPDRIQQAREGVARVEATLSKVTVVVDGAATDQRVRINGREVTAIGVALPYNPGTLTVEAEAPGRKKHGQTVELPPGPASITITIPKLEADTIAPPPPKSQERDHTLAFAVGGAGLGVAALGFAFGGAAWATRDAADEDHCDGTFCSQEGLDLHDRANAFAWTSNVFITTGVLGVGAGVALYFLWPPADSVEGDTKRAGRPLLQVGSGGFHLGWTGPLP